MLPSEYEPLVLSASQQQMKDQYTAMGFSISSRPFSAFEKHLFFFASRPSDADPKRHYSINLHTGSIRVISECLTLVLSQAQQRFGNGGRPGKLETPPCEPTCQESTPTPPERAVVPVPAKPETAQPVALSTLVPVDRERPSVAVESGKATTVASPVRRKQTALF